MDLEQLREQWKSLDIKIDTLSKDNIRLRKKLMDNKARSINYRLMRRIRNIAIVCAIAPVFIAVANLHANTFSTLTIIAAFVYFFTIAAAWIYFYGKLRHTDYLNEPLVESLRQVTIREITMRRIKTLSTVLGIPVVILLLHDIYLHEESDFALLSALTGGIVGGIIGFYISRTNKRLIRSMRDTLHEFEEGA